MSEFTINMLISFAAGFMLARALDSRNGCLKFYTKNKGRTWNWDGSEFRASSLTDQLQDFYSKRVKSSTKELFHND